MYICLKGMYLHLIVLQCRFIHGLRRSLQFDCSKTQRRQIRMPLLRCTLLMALLEFGVTRGVWISYNGSSCLSSNSSRYPCTGHLVLFDFVVNRFSNSPLFSLLGNCFCFLLPEKTSQEITCTCFLKRLVFSLLQESWKPQAQPPFIAD